jgi:hypothetical protein
MFYGVVDYISYLKGGRQNNQTNLGNFLFGHAFFTDVTKNPDSLLNLKFQFEMSE